MILKIWFLTLILNLRIINPSPIRSACSRLPYDFYNLPGTRDYFFLRYERLNPKDAREFCLSIGMDLPSILSGEHNYLIHDFLQKSILAKNLYHTSGIILQNNTIAWLNGDVAGYTNFKNAFSYDPINFHIAVNKTDGKWLAVPSDLEAGVFCYVRC